MVCAECKPAGREVADPAGAKYRRQGLGQGGDAAAAHTVTQRVTLIRVCGCGEVGTGGRGDQGMAARHAFGPLGIAEW